MKTQLHFTFKIISSIIFLFFIMIEEIILSPLRKIKVLVIERTIKKMSAFWTITTLVIFKTIEGAIKFLIPVFADDPWILGFIIFMDGFLGFLSLNLIVHGRENLMTYRWYRKVNIFVYQKKKMVKQTSAYKWSKKQVITIKSYSKATLLKLGKWIFGNERGIFHNLKRYIKFGIMRYKQNKRRKQKLLES